MNKKKWRSKKWQVILVPEKKYNPYENVSDSKLRPVMMWNNSRSLNGWNICFYCSSKPPIKSHKGFCFETKMKKQKTNTWIYMNKIIWVHHKDIGRKIGLVTDSKIKENIIMFISEFFSNDIKIKMEAKKASKI